jgi:YaiO family outer membrane protein
MKKQTTQVLFMLIGLLTVGKAQINTDSIYNMAITYSNNQQYNLAINEAKKALNYHTDRGKILVFIAKVYSWDNKNDSALVYIELAKKSGYHHDDFYAVKADILLLDHQYKRLLMCCDEAENENYSNKEDIFRKRLVAYTELENYDNAIKLIEEPQNKRYLGLTKINDLYSYLLFKRNVNIISADYSLNVFDNSYIPQHVASLAYSLKSGDNKYGIGANYINKFGLNYFQLETADYLKLRNEQYLYFNYGYASNTSLFPQHKIGFEYDFTLPYEIETSFGGRFMNYQRLNSNVFVVTAHIDKYLNENWVAIRPYFIYNYSTKRKSFSMTGNYRLFNENELDYWGAEIDYGNSPDDLYSITQPGGFNQLSAYTIKLERNLRLNRTSDLHIGLSYSNQELSFYDYKNRLTIGLGYKIRLK